MNTPEQPVEPDLISILNSFKNELETMQINLHEIENKLSTIKHFPERKSNAEKSQVDNDNTKKILGEYWRCLEMMNNYNSLLREIKINLTTLVG